MKRSQLTGRSHFGAVFTQALLARVTSLLGSTLSLLETHHSFYLPSAHIFVLEI